MQGGKNVPHTLRFARRERVRVLIKRHRISCSGRLPRKNILWPASIYGLEGGYAEIAHQQFILISQAITRVNLSTFYSQSTEAQRFSREND